MLKVIGFYLFSALLVILCSCSHGLAQTEKKVASAVLIDNTGSLRSQFDDVLFLGKGVVELSHRRGPVSVFNFKESDDKKFPQALISSGVQWSQDKNLIENYLDTLSITSGQTRLYDAIYYIAEQLNAKVDQDKDAFGDKAIFLVTDGEDRGSTIKDKQLIKLLRESGIKVYAFGLVKELDAEGGMIRMSQKEKAIKFLEKIAKETDGRVVFSKSKKDNVVSLLNAMFADRN
ncbi:MAG TPA: VWA domain-containing protein [Pyrinomonadaceae bacterium]|nr:VWA domain-containing protein [Pyrinomonadaceae bacterium]